MTKKKLSQAATSILGYYPQEYQRLTWGQVDTLFRLSLLGDIIQSDPAEDQALFRGPLNGIHIGAERVVFETTWTARRPFPTDGFAYAPQKQDFHVSAARLPWIQTNGVINCPGGDRLVETHILPRADAFQWRPKDIDGLPLWLWGRSRFQHEGVLESYIDEIIPLRAA